MIRDIVTYPCQDACGELQTKRTVDGAPVYRCPGCDSEWYDERERTTLVEEPTPEGTVAAPVHDSQ